MLQKGSERGAVDPGSLSSGENGKLLIYNECDCITGGKKLHRCHFTCVLLRHLRTRTARCRSVGP